MKKWLIKVLIASVILVAIGTQIELAGVWNAVRQSTFVGVLGAFAATMALQVATADRLRRLVTAQGMALGTRDVFEINLSTLFYGLFLPGGNVTGIAIRFYRLGLASADMITTGIALFLDRLIATFTLLGVGIVLFLLEQPEGAGAILWIMLAAMAALGCLIVATFAPADLPWIGTLQKLLRRYGGATINRVCDAMQSQWNLPRSTVLLVVLLATVAHAFGILAYWMIARGMGLELSLLSIGWIRSAMILATMVPLTPSGVGTRELATIAILLVYGVSHEEAVAFSLVVFAATILTTGLVGGLYELRRLLRHG